MVLAGVPLRVAYRQVGLAIEKGEFSAPAQLHRTHDGSLGRLCNEEIRLRMEGLMKSLG